MQILELLAVKFGAPGFHKSRLILPSNVKFSDFQVLKAVVMSRLLRDTRKLREIIQAFMKYQFGDILQLQDSPSPSLSPSGTSLSRYVFAADLALVLYRMQESESEPLVRYGWSDSSPLVGGDWCMNICTALRKSKVLAVFKAASLLDSVAGQLVNEMSALSRTICRLRMLQFWMSCAHTFCYQQMSMLDTSMLSTKLQHFVLPWLLRQDPEST